MWTPHPSGLTHISEVIRNFAPLYSFIFVIAGAKEKCDERCICFPLENTTVLKYFSNLRCSLVQHSLSLNIYIENGGGGGWGHVLCRKEAVLKKSIWGRQSYYFTVYNIIGLSIYTFHLCKHCITFHCPLLAVPGAEWSKHKVERLTSNSQVSQ